MFRGVDLLREPLREHAGYAPQFLILDRSRCVRRSVEGGCKIGVAARDADQRSPSAFRKVARSPYRSIDEVAYRAAVLGPRIAPCLEIARDQRVGSRAAVARGDDDLVEQLDRRLRPAPGRHAALPGWALPGWIVRRLAGDRYIVNMAFL